MKAGVAILLGIAVTWAIVGLVVVIACFPIVGGIAIITALGAWFGFDTFMQKDY